MSPDTITVAPFARPNRSAIDVSGVRIAAPAAIATTWPSGLEATSDAAGLIRFPALSVGSYRLTVAALGYTTAVLDAVPVAADVTTDAEVALSPTTIDLVPTLRVHVVRASGQGQAGAAVRLDGGAFEALSDADGFASFHDLPADAYALEVVPPADAPALPRTLAGLEVAANPTTDVEVRLSGRPPAEATWLGASACLACHPAQAAHWDDSAHAGAGSAAPIREFQDAFIADTTLALATPLGTPVEVRLWRDAAGDQISLTTAAGTRSWVVGAYYGGARTAQVPTLLTGAGPIPAPLGWRLVGEGERAAPAFEAGPFAWRMERWVAEGGAFLTDPITGGPPPEDLEASACLGCHGVGFDLTEAGGRIVAMATDGLSGSVVDRRVGCEACHGPGSSHADAPFEDRADLIVQPGMLDAEAQDAVCGQCHGRGVAPGFTLPVAFPYGPEGQHRPEEDLSTHRVSDPLTWDGLHAREGGQQYDELLLSPHVDNDIHRLGCLDCHDAHGPQPDGLGGTFRAQLRGDPDDNSLCLSCHDALSFPEAGQAADHTAHAGYAPAGPYASGRCIGCHMPPTANRLGVSPMTGGGEVASHAFTPMAPQQSLDAFDAAGVAVLPLDEVPPNSCLHCHQWAETRYAEIGLDFWGPSGDPTLRPTYVTLQTTFETKFPVGP